MLVEETIDWASREDLTLPGTNGGGGRFGSKGNSEIGLNEMFSTS